MTAEDPSNLNYSVKYQQVAKCWVRKCWFHNHISKQSHTLPSQLSAFSLSCGHWPPYQLLPEILHTVAVRASNSRPSSLPSCKSHLSTMPDTDIPPDQHQPREDILTHYSGLLQELSMFKIALKIFVFNHTEIILSSLDWNQKSPHFKYTAYFFHLSSSFTIAALLQHSGEEKLLNRKTSAELSKRRKSTDYSLVAGINCG